MDSITVVIPAEVYNDLSYFNSKTCYLAKALKAAGYTDVVVYGNGLTSISNKLYRPTTPFDHEIVEQTFGNNESISVTLVPE